MKKYLTKVTLCIAVLVAGLLVGACCSNYIQDNEARFLAELRDAPFGTDNRELTFTVEVDDAKTVERWTYFDDVGLDHQRIMSAAGTWEKAVQCAYTVADKVQHRNPPKKDWDTLQFDCFSLWEYGTAKGMNCRMHSFLLSEILTSMGVQNRFVTCLPFNYTEYNECHVVNEVWIPELAKWAMIDSDMNEYVVDEKGIPLSLLEMRQWIIAGKPLMIRPITEKEIDIGYLQAYWTKNLYFFQSPCKYGYDVYQQDTCFIVPEGKEYVLEETYGVDTAEFTRWTTNPDIFWAAPSVIFDR